MEFAAVVVAQVVAVVYVVSAVADTASGVAALVDHHNHFLEL